MYHYHAQILLVKPQKRTKDSIKRLLLLIAIAGHLPISTYGQIHHRSDSTQYFTLDQCIRYALQYQPGLNQSLVNTAIAKTTNAN